MILSYCKYCEYHEIALVDECEYSKCLKNNCLAIHTKCVQNEALRQFICRNASNNDEKPISALEICYPSA